MRAIDVSEGSQVATARRAAAAAARAHGFGDDDAGRVSLVATELATNLVKHAASGVLLINDYDDDSGTGIECVALDSGEGIADVAASMRDGHSTAGSPGTGLGAAWRGSHAFDIYSQAGRGTAVLCRLQRGLPVPEERARQPTFGSVNVPIRGEEACGDSWSCQGMPGRQLLMVADGLGHGPVAAEASLKAITSLRRTREELPSAILRGMHHDLKGTRGAAVGIARLDADGQSIIFAGVGNVAGTALARDGAIQRMVSTNGTIGHVARSFRDFRYKLPANGLVILASDGVGTSWTFERYPGLMQRHPTLIAAVLYRDFHRSRDDATVLVVRASAA